MLTFEEQYDKLVKTIDRNVFDKFAALNSNEERIKFLSSEGKFILDQIILPDAGEMPVKCNNKSLQFRNRGNDFFKQNNHSQALSKYMKSCCYAELKNENHVGENLNGENCNNDRENSLSLSIGNRSAVFYRMKRYVESLIDIDLALGNGYPKHLRYKLFERKGDCLGALMKINEAIEAYQQAADNLKLSELNESMTSKHVIVLEKKKIDLQTSKNGSKELNQDSLINSLTVITKPIPSFNGNSNTTFPALSDSCDVVYDDIKGRHIQANRDIHPGDIVLIEKPFASVLVPEQFLRRCDNCLNPALNALPCLNCVNVIFCSDECRKESLNGFHKLECPILSYLTVLKMDKFTLLILRTILSISPNSIMNYTKTKVRSHFDDSKNVVLNEKGQYSWDDYNAICDLVTNEKKRAALHLFYRSTMAHFLLNLISRTDYFKNIDDQNLENVKRQTGTLILDHFLSFPCNAHEISEIRLDPSSVLTSLPAEVGAGIYSTLSLFNHSCDPSVTRNFYGNVCVVRAIGSIKKGNEVSDNYGTVYQMTNRKQRQSYLMPQYCFQCLCEACKNDWPLYSDSLKQPPTFLCDKCGNTLADAEESVTNFTCIKCYAHQNLVTKTTMLLNSSTKFQKSFELLLNFKPKEAMPGIVEYLNELDKTVNKPWGEFSRGQESLKQCYGMLGNCIMI